MCKNLVLSAHGFKHFVIKVGTRKHLPHFRLLDALLANALH